MPKRLFFFFLLNVMISSNCSEYDSKETYREVTCTFSQKEHRDLISRYHFTSEFVETNEKEIKFEDKNQQIKTKYFVTWKLKKALDISSIKRLIWDILKFIKIEKNKLILPEETTFANKSVIS